MSNAPLYLERYLRHSPADQEPSQPVLRAGEGPFPQTSQPGTHVGWGEVAEAPTFHPLKIYPPASPWSSVRTMWD